MELINSKTVMPIVIVVLCIKSFCDFNQAFLKRAFSEQIAKAKLILLILD